MRMLVRHLLLCFVGLLLFTVACAAPQAAQPAVVRGPSIAGKIAFVRNGTIWLWQGNSARALIGTGETFQPAFAPDGSQLAYIERRNGASDLWLADATGANQRLLARYAGEQAPGSLEQVYASRWVLYPSWTYAGTAVIAAAQPAPPEGDPPADYRLGLTTFPLDGGAPQRLAIEGEADYGRSVAAADGTIIFVRAAAGASGEQQLFRLRSDGSSEPLIDIPLRSYDPAIERNSGRLAFAHSSNGTTDIYFFSEAGGTSTQVTTLSSARAPAFSPSGDALAFLAIAPGGSGFDLWVAAIDNAEDGSVRLAPAQRLTSDAHIDADSGISWAP